MRHAYICKAYLYNSTSFRQIQENFIDKSFGKLSCGKVGGIVHGLLRCFWFSPRNYRYRIFIISQTTKHKAIHEILLKYNFYYRICICFNNSIRVFYVSITCCSNTIFINCYIAIYFCSTIMSNS